MILKRVLLAVILMLFLVSCTNTDRTKTVPENKLCTTDADCLPASCCHAADAVNVANAPKCEGMLCTAECVPETIDCSQGDVKCVEDECKVVLK